VLAVTALLMAVMLGILRTTVTGMETARSNMRRARVATGVLSILRTDLQGATCLGGEAFPALEAHASVPQDGGVVLALTTTNSLAAPQAAAGGLRRVEYLLRPSGRVAGEHEIARRETDYDAAGGPEPDASALERLADGLTAWSVECYDGSDWQMEWTRGRLPRALRVSISLRRDEGGRIRSEALHFCPIVDPDADPRPVPAAATEEESETVIR